MVDYFALIAPTIESLSKSTIEERRQVYDRLIRMLEAQLRSADPPRSEIDILRERIDLEAAIRRVERRIQAGQIAVGSPLNRDALRPVDEQMGIPSAPVGPPPKSLDPSPVPLPAKELGDQSLSDRPESRPVDQDKVRIEINSADRLGEQQAVSAVVPPPSEPPPWQSFRFPETKLDVPAQSARPTDWASLVPQPRPMDRQPLASPRSSGPVTQSERVGDPVSPVSAGALSERLQQSGAYQGQTSHPVQPTSPGPPRRSIEPQQVSDPISRSGMNQSVGYQREPDLGRPIYGRKDADPRQTASKLSELPAAFRSLPGAPNTRQPQIGSDAPRYQPSGPMDASDFGADPGLSQPLHTQRARNRPDQEEAYSDPGEFLRKQAASARSAKRREIVPDNTVNDTARPTVSIGDRTRASFLPVRGSGGWQRLAIVSACLIAILAGIGLTAYMLRDDPAEFETADGKYAAQERPPAEEKIEDRLPLQTPVQNVTPVVPNSMSSASQQSDVAATAAPSTDPAAPVPDANGVLTQSAKLFMEPVDQEAPPPSINGRVTWKLETLKSVVENASEIGSRATVDIPDVGLTAVFVFRRNRDPQSANSHMIEVTFSLADNNTTGKVRDIRVPELRMAEDARGAQLSGVPVPVTENVFLVGLNALQSEMQKNLDLLRSQNWFAMHLRFANGKRGILVFEKGKTGERVMEDAMQAWKVN